MDKDFRTIIGQFEMGPIVERLMAFSGNFYTKLSTDPVENRDEALGLRVQPPVCVRFARLQLDDDLPKFGA